MHELPHEVDRWGPELRHWVEQRLLADLAHYGISRQDLLIDWSQVVQEGHWRDYRGTMFESLSDVEVRDVRGALVASGWMDFVDTSPDNDEAPVVFWLFLDLA
ncbi:MAG: hypothetical protein NTV49_08370, partial [Kiritimatiellaeota bacterium]|nr:hypothetical protein [Kiritimatiellota bacterium]